MGLSEPVHSRNGGHIGNIADMNTPIKPPVSARVPRLSGWAVITVVLLLAVWLLAPQQLPVSLYKLSLLTLAGVVGYWLDRSFYPYARPDQFLTNGDTLAESVLSPDLLLAASMIRRAIIVGAAMLAMALGA